MEIWGRADAWYRQLDLRILVVGCNTDVLCGARSDLDNMNSKDYVTRNGVYVIITLITCAGKFPILLL